MSNTHRSKSPKQRRNKSKGAKEQIKRTKTGTLNAVRSFARKVKRMILRTFSRLTKKSPSSESKESKKHKSHKKHKKNKKHKKQH